jgi:hypothetical protein
MLQHEILLMDNFTQFSCLCLVLASFLLESSYQNARASFKIELYSPFL